MYNVIYFILFYFFALNSLENLFKGQRLNLAESKQVRIW